MTTIEQAIRNAIETERAAAHFYQTLVPKATDGQTREFLEEMARQEVAHAEAIEEMGKRLTANELPIRPDFNIDLVETSPEWKNVESVNLVQALNIAVEAENHAALYYDAMADSFDGGEIREFFKKLMDTELQHAAKINGFLEQLQG